MERRHAARAIAGATVAIGTAVPALAQTAPAGLAPGATYRLVFVTADTIAATSSSIGTYNAFATSEAAQSSSLPSTTWTAIASTDAITAAANIACTPSCANDPIYLVGGGEVASSTANLFSGSIMTPIDLDQNGNSDLNYFAWTGSNTDGTEVQGSGLGSTYPAFGSTFNTNGQWIFQDEEPNTQTDALYAISGELTVPTSTPVPEPATLVLLGTGLAGAALVRRRKRR